jgi:histidyl-tRNA synthetase
VLPEHRGIWDFVLERAEETALLFAYRRIETPALGDTSLFARTSGAGSDIVEHEMYTFRDRGGDEVTLRPEGTAPVMRAYLQHGMDRGPQPVKLYYVERMYRYERPQRGRFREHRQLGCEAIGLDDPYVDVEMIALVRMLVSKLGLKDVTLQLNSIGDGNCRPQYVSKLREYLVSNLDNLSPIDRERLDRNVLRVLDTKEERSGRVIETAPILLDDLCEPCRRHWDKVTHGLGRLGIGYTVNPRLVRGLDYYTRTVFEFTPAGGGSTSTLVAGGRYDALSEAMAGPHVPGIGFGAGVERLVQEVQEQNVNVPVRRAVEGFVTHAGDETADAALRVCEQLREAGVAMEMAFGERSLKSQMKQAGNSGARFVVILGPDELATGQVTLRVLHTGQQQQIGRRDLLPQVRSLLAQA